MLTTGFFFFQEHMLENLNSRKSWDHPLTTQIKFVNFFDLPPTIIQIKIILFYMRFFVEDLTCCQVFSLNVFIHFIT